jgi:structural maintenance of chromosomes protein 5
VLGPLCLEINCPNPEHARLLENFLPKWMLTTFIFQCDEDRTLFTTEMRDRQKIKVSAVYTPPGALNRQHNRIADLADLAKYGITHWMDQVFEAPAIIKDTIANQFPLHQSAIGSKKTEQRVDVRGCMWCGAVRDEVWCVVWCASLTCSIL